MILLQSLDKFNDVAELDVGTGQMQRHNKADRLDHASQPVHGHFAELNGVVICFFRHDNGQLHLKIGPTDIELPDDANVSLQREVDNQVRLVVLRRGLPAFNWRYRRPKIDPPLMADPTPFVDEEDFDILLLAFNVINDNERRRKIYR